MAKNKEPTLSGRSERIVNLWAQKRGLRESMARIHSISIPICRPPTLCPEDHALHPAALVH